MTDDNNQGKPTQAPERMTRQRHARSRDRVRAASNTFSPLELNPKHLIALTDATGILQHAHYSVPNPHHGYSTDDQARALIVVAKAEQLWPDAADWNTLAARYLSFLVYAFDEESQRFGNFMNYQRTWTKPVATEDVHARAMWALASVTAFSSHGGYRAAASDLLTRAMSPALAFTSPRAWAFTLLAIHAYLRQNPDAPHMIPFARDLTARLLGMTHNNADEDWPWPEQQLTYANARLPHALLEAGDALSNAEASETALRLLRWLDRLQTSDQGSFSPIGSNGWYRRGGGRARFDQQPIEACAHIDACVSAYRITGQSQWRESAQRAFEWFLGRNDIGAALCDEGTGACCDGLHQNGVNQNQGAESTVCWLLSVLAMNELQALSESRETHEVKQKKG